MKKFIYLPFVMLLFFTLLTDKNSYASTLSAGYLDEKNRTMVPIRFISEEIGATVIWDKNQRLVTIVRGEANVQIRIGEKYAYVNGTKEQMDTVAVIKNNTTYIPLRFVSETLKAKVKWDSSESRVIIEDNGKVFSLYVARGEPITYSKQSIKVGSKTLAANIVKIDLRHPSVDLKVGLAKGQVGQVEDLSQLAKRHGAAVAINGTFFDAYTSVTEPYGLIVADGKAVHIGRDRTVIGFDKNNRVLFDLLEPTIVGTTNNSSQLSDSWFAYWINRTPNKSGDSIHIFTPERGSTIGFSFGTNVIVRNNIVTEVKKGNVTIPKDGYVINFLGTYESRTLPRFQVGEKVDYNVSFDTKLTNSSDWEQVEGALGVGPRLVTNGKVTVNLVDEKFTQSNMLTGAGARSAVGVTKDGYMLLVTTSATMRDLGSLMQKIGAVNAMNLDGGASSGLYYKGSYITRTGRQISNALLVIQK